VHGVSAGWCSPPLTSLGVHSVTPRSDSLYHLLASDGNERTYPWRMTVLRIFYWCGSEYPSEDVFWAAATVVKEFREFRERTLTSTSRTSVYTPHSSNCSHACAHWPHAPQRARPPLSPPLLSVRRTSLHRTVVLFVFPPTCPPVGLLFLYLLFILSRVFTR
jgi:hypothetical protein